MSMREDFDAAIATLDADEDLESTPQEILADEPDEIEAPAEETPDGAFTPAEENVDSVEAAKAPTSAEDAEKASAESNPTPEGEPDAEPAKSIKAPAGWSPADREQWSKVPPALQARITAREQEMVNTMADTREARQLQETFNDVGKSFAPIMAAEGFSHPMEAMQAAFGTMTNLRMGTPQQKAQEVARIVSQYGIDINALDEALVGGEQGNYPQQQQVNPQNQQFEQLLDQRMAPVNQLMETVQQAQQSQQQAKLTEANNQVAQFAQKNEFLPDVREDMADIIELAAKRGVQLDLQTAYDRATAAHPEISGIIAQRKNDEAIMGQQNSIAAKRAAASSVSGRRGGTGNAGGAVSLRDSIAAAFDETR